ncbi:MAG: hypothetical protein R3203_10200 [Pseudoalteromonas tetraodonis]|nr:hypothetical protein [Pseudoalteromonas tetraodonis]
MYYGFLTPDGEILYFDNYEAAEVIKEKHGGTEMIIKKSLSELRAYLSAQLQQFATYEHRRDKPPNSGYMSKRFMEIH